MKQTLPHPLTPAMQMTTTQLTMMQTMREADNNADVDADNNNAMQTTDDDSNMNNNANDTLPPR
jgi:hypothetical protein